MDFKYKTIFASAPIKCILGEDQDKYLAQASVKELTKYIPNVDSATHIDFLPFAANGYIGSRTNKNGDLVDAKTTVEMASLFTYVPINLEHKRGNICGVILSFFYQIRQRRPANKGRGSG